MTRTINLSRARSFSRRKRAKKAMSILRHKLEEQEQESVSISSEVNARIWQDGVENPPAKLEVEVVKTEKGLRAVLPQNSGETRTETETKEKETENDYEEAVSGTVSEAKEAIKEMESPDYEELLEAEKINKDRKGLKNWLESRM